METIRSLLGSGKQPADPSLATSENTTAPHVPGEFPGDNVDKAEDETSNKRSSLYFAKGLGPGGKPIDGLHSDDTGAAGAASSGGLASKDIDDTTASAPKRESFYGRPESSSHVVPTQQSGTEQAAGEHHYGRDAAVAGGATAAAGAAGVGAHELSKGHDEPRETSTADKLAPTETTDAGKSAEPAGKSAEPTQGSIEPHQLTTAADRQAGTSATDPTQTTATDKRPEESHFGRDAAVAGGATAGLGAAGVGAYELSKDRGEPSQTSTADKLAPSQATDAGKSAAPTQGSIEPHQLTTAADRQAGTSATEPTQTTATDKRPEESHTGRDAAIAGGATAAAGAVGYGAYEHEQAKKEEAARQEAERAASEKQAKQQQKEAEERAKEERKAAEARQKEAEKREKEQRKEAEKAEKEREKAEKERQKEAERAEKDRQKEIEKREKEERKAAEKREKEEAAAAKEREKQERKDAERREQEQKAAALEAEKRDREEKRLAEEQAKKDQETHYGRDAAVVGGVGAAGVGAYELSKHEEEKRGAETTLPSRSKESETVPASRDVQDSHVGRDAAVVGGAGTAGAGATAFGNRERDFRDADTTAGRDTTLGRAGPADARANEPSRDVHDSHVGRDAAVVGGVGAAGVGAHEVSKHEQGGLRDADDTTALPAYSSNQTGSHTGHDPALVGGAGAADARAHEPSKDVHESHAGRDAAFAGGVGAAGVGAAAATHSGSAEHGALPSETEHGAYELSGKGYVASEPELENKFATYTGVHDDNPERTQAMMEKIRRTEEEKARTHAAEPPEPKKEGLLHKILHPHIHKRNKEEAEAAEASGTHTGGTHTAGASAASHPTGNVGQGESSALQGLPHDEHGHIVIQKEGADPDAPHLVVHEKPGGGLETTQQ